MLRGHLIKLSGEIESPRHTVPLFNLEEPTARVNERGRLLTLVRSLEHQQKFRQRLG
jgi:hypothetical protein